MFYGTVIVTSNKTLMYTSIPYDEGWKLKVEGKKADYIKILNGFIGIDLTEGKHEIEFKYELPGLKIGMVISIISLAILIGETIYKICRNLKNS